VQYRDFERGDEVEIVRLLSAGRPGAYGPFKAKVFDWQFLQNPHADGRSPFLVGELDSRIVALNGFMPARVWFRGKPIQATWSCDTYVSSELRGQGIGKQLITLVTRSAPLMLGYGISDMSDPIFAKHEWVLHTGLELVFFHLAERGLRGRIKNAASKLSSLRAPRVAAEVEVWDRPTPAEYGELEALWERNARDYASAVQRDAAYLKWKYFDHPLYHYVAYAQRVHGQLEAVMIVRHDPEESVIVDYSGPATDEDAIASLAGDIVRDHGDRETLRIKCESTHAALIAALHRVGFISSPYASRFRVRCNTQDGDPTAHGWLLTPGDSDGDVIASTTLQTQAVGVA
jgi:GNAT superfamily N-acetyltransferase